MGKLARDATWGVGDGDVDICNGVLVYDAARLFDGKVEGTYEGAKLDDTTCGLGREEGSMLGT